MESRRRHQRLLTSGREVDKRRVLRQWLRTSTFVALAVLWIGAPVVQASASTRGRSVPAIDLTTAGGSASRSGHSGSAKSTLTISVASLTVTVGGTINPTVSIGSGLSPKDTATVTGTIFHYAGTGATVYPLSTTPPTAIGTYSTYPSGSTVTISPSKDQANYSPTYIYIGSTLVIKAVVVVVVRAPHATRVVGDAVVGERRTLTIIGTYFSANPSVTSNGPGALVHVYTKSANRIVLSVAVSKSSRPGTHIFTITTSAGKRCRIGYITRYWRPGVAN
jgi:hypothetical protein